MEQARLSIASHPAARIPLVVDSPHSGLAFPAEGRCVAPPDALLSSWDAYVDRLWAGTPDAGGCLVAATFHRAFIDATRDELDIVNIDDGQSRPDLVVSDRVGTTADPAFTRWVASCWSELGYHAAINHPYSGGDIVRRYGAPARGRHSIQIEINRRLYMNERTFEPHAGIEKLEQSVRTFLMRLRSHIHGLLSSPST